MTPALHVGLGVAATVLAGLRVAAWGATGSLIGVSRLRASAAIRTAVSILAGACLTMLIYATLASMRVLLLAVLLDAAVAVLSLAARARETGRLFRATAQLLLPSSHAGRAALTAALCLLWVVAIGPPRDGDVMHYHLAHIREIIAHGGWRQLPICSYGIPFGWSLTYLPFEWMGLPQTAHLLNAVAWLLSCALCVERVKPTMGTGKRDPHEATRWMLLCLTLLPAVLKAATTAMADSFMILEVALVVALLMEWPAPGRSGAAALGFAACCGLTTRYQAAAVVIAASVIVGIEGIRNRESRTLLVPFFAGALVAVIAAAPFYLANALTLGSPMWPFAGTLVRGGQLSSLDGTTQAVQQLAASCATTAVTGGLGTAAAAAGRLFIDRSVFPIPALVAAGCILALTFAAGGTRRVGLFILLFMGAWVAAQPSLAPRFSIYLVAAAVVCCSAPLSSLLATRAAPAARIAGGVSLGVLAIASGMYARDYVRLIATGDLARFHHATWYWGAYDWANRETPPDARFVVALYGGDTYPLDRWNISADPGSSAALPWTSITNSCGLGKFMVRVRADYMFYGPNVWTGHPMDARIDDVVEQSIRVGTLREVRSFEVPIVYSRMRGLELQSRVTLYRVDRSAVGAACAQPTSGASRP